MNVPSTMDFVNKFLLIMWVVTTDTLVQTIILVMVRKLLTNKSGLFPYNTPTSTIKYGMVTLQINCDVMQYFLLAFCSRCYTSN